MTDLLQTGSDWLEAQRHEHASHAVVYKRGAEEISVDATVGMTRFDVEKELGVETWQSRDFLIRAQDLVLGGEQTEPAAGDQVKETINSEVLVFEVMAPGDEPPFRYSDPGRKTLRIHTKLVEKETS